MENKKEGFFQQRPKARAGLGPRPNPEALRVVAITILAHMQPFAYIRVYPHTSWEALCLYERSGNIKKQNYVLLCLFVCLFVCLSLNFSKRYFCILYLSFLLFPMSPVMKMMRTKYLSFMFPVNAISKCESFHGDLGSSFFPEIFQQKIKSSK